VQGSKFKVQSRRAAVAGALTRFGSTQRRRDTERTDRLNKRKRRKRRLIQSTPPFFVTFVSFCSLPSLRLCDSALSERAFPPRYSLIFGAKSGRYTCQIWKLSR